MLIFLYGEDTFRSRQKLNEIIKEYQTKHQSGLNLVRLREESANFEQFRQNAESISMFNEKKLLILDNCLNSKTFQEEFLKYIKKSKPKNNPEVIMVIYQAGKFGVAPFKSRLNMSEEFKSLRGGDLVNWLKKEVAKRGGQISALAAEKLAAAVGNDLWRMDNEISKLISYCEGEIINPEQIDLLIKAELDLNIFKTLDALAQRDKKTALKLLHQHLSEGENEIYLLSMFVYQVRILLRLKDLIERGAPFNDLVKKTKFHPYVVKKSWSQLNNFSSDQLKKIFRRLLEIDLALKSGQLDGPTALDLLVTEM